MTIRPTLGFLGLLLLGGCFAMAERQAAPPANAGYCASLGLLLDSVDPRMAAAARADMARAQCVAAP